jgi:cytochrome c-type biogenesis protein CcmH
MQKMHRVEPTVSKFVRRLCAFVLALALSVAPALAVLPDEVLKDPAQEARARAISANLRCMVCQNESIDASNAPLARDLRLLVRERINAGDSDDQIYSFLVARYGDFVLLNPRFTATTALLWLAPALLLVVGVAGIVMVARRRPQTAAAAAGAAPLTAAEEARIAALLDREAGQPQPRPPAKPHKGSAAKR